MAQFLMTRRVFARERLTITTATPVKLTRSIYEDATGAPKGGNQMGTFKRKAAAAQIMLENSTGSIHFTVDGTAPTTGVTASDVGAPVNALDLIILESQDAIEQFQAIALSGQPNCIAEVWYLR